MIRLLTSTAVAASLAIGTYALPAFSTGAFAAGESSGSSSTRKPNCRKDYVYDEKKEKCVKAEKSSGLSDDNLYGAAQALAYAGRYDEVLSVLDLVENAQTPRMLTYRGFATRKLGDVEAALPYYRAALALDPGYTLAREYMGEAFLQIGRVDLAREQLSKIEQICGTVCEEYKTLAVQIEAAS